MSAECKEQDSLVKRLLFGGSITARAMNVCYALGAGLSLTGRLTGQELLPAVLPLVDAVSATSLRFERFACYAAYGAGVATAYADKIYAVVDLVRYESKLLSS